MFFATFEWVKQQGYYYFLDEMYGLHIDSRKRLHQLEGLHRHHKDKENDDIEQLDVTSTTPITESKVVHKERPPLMLEPIFVILAGAAAAVVCYFFFHLIKLSIKIFD